MSERTQNITDKLLHLSFVVTGFTLISMVVVESVGGIDSLSAWVENAGAWAPVVYLGLKASTYIFAPLSGSSIEMAAGALFGVWHGAFLSLIGSTLGGVANYWIARFFGRKGIAKFAGQKALAQVDHATEHVANWRLLAAARIALSPIYDFISYAAGLTQIPFWQYVVISFVGGMPIAIIFPLIGHTTISSSGGSYIMMAVSAATFVGLGSLLFYRRFKRSASN